MAWRKYKKELRIMKKIKCIYSKAEKLWRDEEMLYEVLEYMYLVLLGMFLLQSAFWNTMFTIPWPVNYHYYLHLALGVFIFAKFFIMKKPSLWEASLIFLTLLGFIAAWRINGYDEIFDMALLVVGAYQVNYKKILKLYLSITFPITISAIIASNLGIITNLIYELGGRHREALGFNYPTDLAARIFMMMAAWVLLREIRCTYYELILMILTAFWLDVNCDSRCSEICILLMVGAVFYLKIRNQKAAKKGNIYQPSKYIKWLCIISTLIFSSTMVLLMRFYNPDNKILAFLNKALTERLKFGKRTFDDYNVTLLGQYVAMEGNGRKTNFDFRYTFIDCSYLNMLMRFGIIVFIIVLFLIEITMIRNYNNIFILGLIALICLHSAIEHHFFEYYYNFFMLLPMASFKDTNNIGFIAKIRRKYCLQNGKGV